MSSPSLAGSWCCPGLALLCCGRAPMGAGLSQTQDGAVLAAPHAAQPATMAEVVRERKRKMNGGLATLRRRLLAGRRTRGVRCSRDGDRAAPLRDLLKEWSPLEVGALLEEYEALAALRDLCVQAELARPPAAALCGDLATLYDQRICPDAELIFKGACFPVHRAVLSARCPYFRELLNGYPSVGARVCLEAPLPPQVDTAALDGLLRYLYAGEPAAPPCPACDVEAEPFNRRRANVSVPDCCPSQSDQSRATSSRLGLDIVGVGVCTRRPDPVLLRRLASDLGAAPAALHRDMRHLLDTAELADASLVFTSEPPSEARIAARQASPPASDYGFRPRLELPCHRAVLSARSPFFRSVIQRRCRQQGAEAAGSVKIVLDERVIPHKYARVLLHAVYTDQVDLNLIMRGGGSIFGCSILGSHGSSLGEAQVLAGSQQAATGPARGATLPGPHPTSPIEEAMELYEIGRFLELDILSQGCEDIIAERLSANSLAAVLKWSSQPHGSKWVHRQALRYLREEFQTVALGPALPQLEAAHLAHALRCPFLQASELDALRAALRWGEHRLVKRMEDREPNLLSHTAHSVTRKGVKKRDLSDAELRELLAELLPLVRIDHILPPNCELLAQVVRRGLLSSPPACMLGGDAPASRADAWIRGKGGLYVRPRLYMPYYEEVKALLEDQMVQEAELVRMRRARYIPDIPDTLYMVSAEPRARSSGSGAPAESPRGAAPSAPGAVPPAAPVLRAMLNRERELRRAPACARATSLPLSHTQEITRQIRLRVVREFNLPDSVADLLEAAALELPQPQPSGQSTRPDQAAHRPLDGDDTDNETDELGSRRCLQNSREGLESWCGGSPMGSRRPLPALLTEGDNNRPHSVESTAPRQRRRHQTGRGLSQAMPDVAMATSSLGRLRLSQDLVTVHSRGRPDPQPSQPEPCPNSSACLNTSYKSEGCSSVYKPDACLSAAFAQAESCSNQSYNVEACTSQSYSAESSYNPLEAPHLYGSHNESRDRVDQEPKDESASYHPENGLRDSGFNAVSREICTYSLTRDRGHPNSRESCSYSLNRDERKKDGNLYTTASQNAQTSRDEANLSMRKTKRDDSSYSLSTDRKRDSCNVTYSEDNPVFSLGERKEGTYSLQRDNSCINKRDSCTTYTPNDQNAYAMSKRDSNSLNRSSYSGEAYKRECASYDGAETERGKEDRGQYGWTERRSVPFMNPNQHLLQEGCGLGGYRSWTHGDPSAFQRTEGEGAPPLQLDLGDGNQHASPARQMPGPQVSWSRTAETRLPERRSAATLPADYGQPQFQSGRYSRYLSPCGPQLPLSTFQPQPEVQPPSAFQNGFSTLQLQSRSRSPRGAPRRPPPTVPAVQRSHSAGSVAGEDIPTNPAVHNVSGYNHPPPYSSAPASDAPSRASPLPRPSALPEAMSLYESRNSAYHIGTNLIENSWVPPYMNTDDRNAMFLRNSRDSFYGTYGNRDNLRTMVSNFDGNAQYSRGESPFSCIQNQRPGSCGLADIMQVSNYNTAGEGSRGESPLYGGLNSSRGSSPFRTLDSNPAQFSRGNSPYSSGHRMDYAARMQQGNNERINDTYCQPGSMQRSASPGCRAYVPQNQQTTRTLSNSPSNLKLQSRMMASSPSSGNFNQGPKMQQQGQRTLSSSPSAAMNFPQTSLKSQHTSRTLSSSPSSNSFNQTSAKMQNRTSPSSSFNQKIPQGSSNRTGSSSPSNYASQSGLKVQQPTRNVTASPCQAVKTSEASQAARPQSRDGKTQPSRPGGQQQYHVPGTGPPRYL